MKNDHVKCWWNWHLCPNYLSIISRQRLPAYSDHYFAVPFSLFIAKSYLWTTTTCEQSLWLTFCGPEGGRCKQVWVCTQTCASDHLRITTTWPLQNRPNSLTAACCPKIDFYTHTPPHPNLKNSNRLLYCTSKIISICTANK